MALLLPTVLLMPEHNRVGAASHNTAFAGFTECKTEFGECLMERLERPKVSVISDRWVGGLVHKRWRNTFLLGHASLFVRKPSSYAYVHGSMVASAPRKPLNFGSYNMYVHIRSHPHTAVSREPIAPHGLGNEARLQAPWYSSRNLR